jgi:hypothetical protein
MKPETFLANLQEHFDKEISPADVTKYLLEGPFLKEKIVPGVYSFLQSQGYGKAEAQRALLAEGCRDPLIKELVSGTPSSKQLYPFQKGISRAMRSAQKEWWEKGKGLHPSCPDFALLSPHRIVFEGKLFREGGPQKARREIVHGVYECAFYRGLPTLLSGGNLGGLSYDYACLVAFDTTAEQSLVAAWQHLNEDVKRAFWTELRVYVMILPNGASMAQLLNPASASPLS